MQLSQLEASVHAADAPTLELLGKSTSKWMAAAHMANPAPAVGETPVSCPEDASRPVSSSSTSDSDTASTDAALTAAADSPSAPPDVVSSGTTGGGGDSSSDSSTDATPKPSSSSDDSPAHPSTHAKPPPNGFGSPVHPVVPAEQAAATDGQHQGQVVAGAAAQRQ